MTTATHSTDNSSGQPLSTERARQLIDAAMPRLREDLSELLAFRSVHSVPELAEDNAGAAQWVVDAYRAVGIPVEPHVTSDGSTSVIGLKPAAEGYPTILLYSHFDVQPAGPLDAWDSDPWTLTERDGRWYGRGTADCKGNVVLHLAVLRSLQTLIDEGHSELDKVGIRVVVEGSEERGGYGLEDLLAERPDLFAADVFMIADSGNDALGSPSICTALRGAAPIVVTAETVEQPLHSGQFGGAAPDALLELIKLLSTLHDDNGLLAVEGLTSDARWEGAGPDIATFRSDAGVLDGVEVIGERAGLLPNDLTVARCSVTVTGLDATSVPDAINSVPARAAAVVHLRVAPGYDPKEAQDLLLAHLEKHASPRARFRFEPDTLGEPFQADTSGPALSLMSECLADAYGAESSLEIASGGSIPLTNKLLSAHPDAELALYGIAEPQCRIHSPNESVHPEEVAAIAAAELLFLARCASALRG